MKAESRNITSILYLSQYCIHFSVMKFIIQSTFITKASLFLKHMVSRMSVYPLYYKHTTFWNIFSPVIWLFFPFIPYKKIKLVISFTKVEIFFPNWLVVLQTFYWRLTTLTMEQVSGFWMMALFLGYLSGRWMYWWMNYAVFE